MNFHIWQTTCLMCKAKRQCTTCEQWQEEAAYTTHGWRVKRDRVCASCRARVAARTLALRSRRRLHRRVEKTRLEKRKRVLEEVRREIDMRRQAGRVACTRCGAETTASPLATQSYSYECPRCMAKVESTKRDGRINNRRSCGHTFTVAAGEVVEPPLAVKRCVRYVYACPQCKAKVESSTRDGCINNQRKCGHKFTVAAGEVVHGPLATQSYSYECPRCMAKVESTKRDGRIDNRRSCGHTFTVAAGEVVEPPLAVKCYVYECPQCKAKVASSTENGCIDNRRNCGHQFHVSAGAVRVKPAAPSQRHF